MNVVKKIKYVTCSRCHGSGGTMLETCTACRSTGKVAVVSTPETIVLGEN